MKNLVIATTIFAMAHTRYCLTTDVKLCVAKPAQN